MSQYRWFLNVAYLNIINWNAGKTHSIEIVAYLFQ